MRDLLTKEECGDCWIVGPYVYRFYGADRQPLYIGVTTGSAVRWYGHRRESPWWPLAEYVAVSFYKTYEAAMEAERAAIRAEQPQFNRQWMKPRMQTLVKFGEGAEAIAAELHRIAPPHLVRELAELLASPERFPQPESPPPAFPESG